MRGDGTIIIRLRPDTTWRDRFIRLALVLAVVSVGCYLVSRTCLFAWSSSYGGKMWDIGKFSTRAEAERAAVRKLSRQLCQCPSQEKYWLYWESKDGGGYAFCYSEGRLWNEIDPGSGFWGDVFIADEAAIHAAARRGAGFEAFPIAK
jgi:hypothetical protein